MSGAPTHRTGKGKGAFRRSQASLPGRSADALFDPDRTITVRCHVCGATRHPGEDRAAACSVDRDRELGALHHRRRPVGCLNHVNPATTEWPDGY